MRFYNTTSLNEEFEKRAKARKELRDYLIDNNGNYNSIRITKLIDNSKGSNTKFDNNDRRETEASVFNKK